MKYISKMSSKKNLLIKGLCLLFLISVISISDININVNNHIQKDSFLYNENLPEEKNYLDLAATSNFENLEAIISDKLNQFSSLGCFPQIYESSLQATFYALYILDAIDKINDINRTAVLKYIMKHYNESKHVFMDAYAYRYLDFDFYRNYFPYTSVLEVNCYALLSLCLLGEQNLIDIQQSVNFIWSCYNPQTSGFIGRPYSSSLNDYFRTSTMDNTYYAIATLDTLMHDWSGYNIEKIDLINYIQNLQSMDSWEWYFGGFYNDIEEDFESLRIFEPNLLSIFYCIKSLQVFDVVNIIRINDLHQYLNGIYYIDENFFDMAYFVGPDNYLNIIATAIGLEIADLTDFSSIDRNGVINFLLNNRNLQGVWNSSTEFCFCELIDIFQVVRALKNTGVLYQLSSVEKQLISNAVAKFLQYNHGYSLISEDYTTLENLYTIVNAFYKFNRTSELDASFIYQYIDNSYHYYQYINYDEFFFLGCRQLYQSNGMSSIISFRSYPIEFYTTFHYNNYIDEIGEIYSHKSTYFALQTLKYLNKFEEFAAHYNLNELINDIVESQFLNSQYGNDGGFLPRLILKEFSPEYQNSSIFFEHSYYAIKSLELLANELGLGDISNIIIDIDEFYDYISQYKFENSTVIYFNPYNESNINQILEDTYQTVCILKILNLFDLPVEKVRNFVVQNLDYSNIKNIYFIFKLAKVLNFEIEFDLDLVHNLVQNIFSEKFNEYFLSTKREFINQEIFLWISEMATDRKLRMKIQYNDSVLLESSNEISVTLCNLILEGFHDSMIVTFESAQLGAHFFEEQPDHSFHKHIFIPAALNNYPQITGKICVYENNVLKLEKIINFSTTYQLEFVPKILKNSEKIEFNINSSLIFGDGLHDLSNSQMYAKIFKNNEQIETEFFTSQGFLKYTIYIMEYIPDESGIFQFQIFIHDNFQPNPVNILNETYLSLRVKSPNVNEMFGKEPPSFDVEIDDPNIDLIWYTVNNGTRWSENITLNETSGTLKQELWNECRNGTVIFRVWANDTLGNNGYAELNIRKDEIAPKISILDPKINEEFGDNAPLYEINLDEGNLDEVWYTLDNGKTNHTINNSSGKIDQITWDNCESGVILLKFYANDTLGNLGCQEILIVKESKDDNVIIINPPEDDDDSSDLFDLNNWIIIGFLIVLYVGASGTVVYFSRKWKFKSNDNKLMEKDVLKKEEKLAEEKFSGDYEQLRYFAGKTIDGLTE